MSITVAVGDALPSLTTTLTRLDLVKYAGASGDFNVIHWNERVATQVGLPNVIAHGMLTMAEAVRVVTDWLGDPRLLESYGVKFTRPVVVPDDADGAVLEVSATVAELLDDARARIAITATFGGQTVLGKAQAVVRIP